MTSGAMGDADIRWQQRFSNDCRVLVQLEGFFIPDVLNEREEQGLIKAFEYTFELGWITLRDLLRSQGNADLLGSRDTLREAFRVGLVADGEGWMLMIQDRNLTSHTYNPSTARLLSGPARAAPVEAGGGEQVITIPGLPEVTSARLLEVLRAHPHVNSIWLYGSRAMGRHTPASDIDLTLGGDQLSHNDLLQLLARIDDLLLPWQVDLSLRQTLPEDLQAHVGRVGQCLWSRTEAAAAERSTHG